MSAFIYFGHSLGGEILQTDTVCHQTPGPAVQHSLVSCSKTWHVNLGVQFQRENPVCVGHRKAHSWDFTGQHISAGGCASNYGGREEPKWIYLSLGMCLQAAGCPHTSAQLLLGLTQCVHMHLNNRIAFSFLISFDFCSIINMNTRNSVYVIRILRDSVSPVRFLLHNMYLQQNLVRSF